MIERYLSTAYADGGRGPRVYDCWGLVRAVRHELFGLPLLPSYGAISPDDKRALTEACNAEAVNFAEGPPVPGAIVTAWRGRLCVHVGVCVVLDGRPGVLDTGRATGPRWQPVNVFRRQFLKVVFHHDRDLSVDSARRAD